LSFEITKSRANSATALIYYSEVITFKKIFTIFNLTGCNSPPLGAFNALGDTPLLCGGVIHFLHDL